jgi:ammonium transporter, Amt family
MTPINQADTAWMLIATAMVLVMTPALGFFYGGLVRAKNTLNTMMMSYVALGFVGIAWAFIGYTFAFSTGSNWLGGLDNAFFRGVGLDAKGTIPHILFAGYQATFCVITAALISGAIVERMRFGPYVAFITLWSVVVYAPIAHWVWGGGWLGKLGALDFAGGTVVHVNAAAAALVVAVVLGARKDYARTAIIPQNVPFTLLGAGLLWFGWFGFNAGSALGANGLAAHAFTTTNTATAAAALGWMFTEWSTRGKPTVLGAASGAVAGLVAITPAAGFVTPMAAIVIGALAGVFCYTACNLKTKLGYDDSLDVVGVHGVGGTWGALATGIFATKLVNDAGGDGLLYGNPKQLGIQLVAVLVTMVLGFVGTIIILKVLDALMGLRVSDEDEQAGLDLSQHSETAYSFGGGSEYSQTAGGGGAFAEAMRAAEAKARSR